MILWIVLLFLLGKEGHAQLESPSEAPSQTVNQEQVRNGCCACPSEWQLITDWGTPQVIGISVLVVFIVVFICAFVSRVKQRKKLKQVAWKRRGWCAFVVGVLFGRFTFSWEIAIIVLTVGLAFSFSYAFSAFKKRKPAKEEKITVTGKDCDQDGNSSQSSSRYSSHRMDRLVPACRHCGIKLRFMSRKLSSAAIRNAPSCPVCNMKMTIVPSRQDMNFFRKKTDKKDHRSRVHPTERDPTFMTTSSEPLLVHNLLPGSGDVPVTPTITMATTSADTLHSPVAYFKGKLRTPSRNSRSTADVHQAPSPSSKDRLSFNGDICSHGNMELELRHSPLRETRELQQINEETT